jgi:hypothetical protein
MYPGRKIEKTKSPDAVNFTFFNRIAQNAEARRSRLTGFFQSEGNIPAQLR